MPRNQLRRRLRKQLLKRPEQRLESRMVIAFLYAAFTVADCCLYSKAKWPEKRQFWWWMLPGSGFYSYVKFGPNR